MPTVLITGCSSGFGAAIAQHFLDRDWQVVATMRKPDHAVLPQSSHLRILALDVTDAQSIEQAVAAAGPIDVLVNNAGVGVLNALEGISMNIARTVFETNTLGTIALTQAVLPQFRQRRAGVIVNVTSTVTLRALPFLAVYTASKAAVNAFTESLALELQPFNIQAKLVLPGRSMETSFAANALQEDFPEAYADGLQKVFAAFSEPGDVTYPNDVAEAVWRAATDPASPTRIPAGADAVQWAKEAQHSRLA